MSENTKKLSSRELLYHLIHQFKGDRTSIINAISNRKWDYESTESCTVPPIDNGDTHFSSIIDADFPEIFKKPAQTPIGIFYRGDLNLLSEDLHKERVSIYGTSKPTDKALKQTVILANEYASQNKILVTDCCKGINTAATETFIKAGAKVIVLLPSGLDNIYPVVNKKLVESVINNGGLVLSTLPNDVGASTESCVYKNILLSTLFSEITFIQIREKSGCAMLASFALRNNADILVVPNTSDREDFGNHLVQEGAYPLFEIAYQGD